MRVVCFDIEHNRKEEKVNKDRLKHIVVAWSGSVARLTRLRRVFYVTAKSVIWWHLFFGKIRLRFKSSLADKTECSSTWLERRVFDYKVERMGRGGCWFESSHFD